VKNNFLEGGVLIIKDRVENLLKVRAILVD